MFAPTQHDEFVATRQRHVEKLDAVVRLAGCISRDLGELIESAGATARQLLAEIPPTHPASATRAPDAILVVDDDEWVRTVVSRVLRRAGWGVLEADSGLAALELLRGIAGSCVRLVLTDMMMPGMTGPALAETVRRHHRGTPVLLMSELSVDMLPLDRLGGLGDTVLVKPFTPGELLAAVRRQLNGAA